MRFGFEQKSHAIHFKMQTHNWNHFIWPFAGVSDVGATEIRWEEEAES